MKIKSIFLSMFATMLVSFAMYAQQNISYLVEHGTDIPSTANGCSVVSLKVVYTQSGGGTYLATSSSVQLDQNTGTWLSTTIPSGATVLSKTIVFSFTLSSNTYQYVITNSNNSAAPYFTNCNCPPISSRSLQIQEYAGRSSKVVYYLTDVVGGGC